MACSTHIYYPIWKTAPQTFSVVCLFVFKLFLDVLQLTTNVSYSNTYICYINSELYIICSIHINCVFLKILISDIITNIYIYTIYREK